MPARAPSPALFFSPWQPLIRAFARAASQTFQPGQFITSYFRTPLGNQAAGGSNESQHLFAIAIDLAGPNLAASRHLAKRLKLFAVMEPDHLHIQMFGPGVLKRAGVQFPRPPIVTTFAPSAPTVESERFA